MARFQLGHFVKLVLTVPHLWSPVAFTPPSSTQETLFQAMSPLVSIRYSSLTILRLIQRCVPGECWHEFRATCSASDNGATQVKEAYRRLQKVCHPDLAGEVGGGVSILLNEAFSVLTDVELRKVRCPHWHARTGRHKHA